MGKGKWFSRKPAMQDSLAQLADGYGRNQVHPKTLPKPQDPTNTKSPDVITVLWKSRVITAFAGQTVATLRIQLGIPEDVPAWLSMASPCLLQDWYVARANQRISFEEVPPVTLDEKYEAIWGLLQVMEDNK